MSKDLNIEALVRELRIEAWKEGYHSALYNHTDGFHTVKKRQEMLDHKIIADKIQKVDIVNALKKEE